MDNFSQAIEVAVSVRSYLLENVGKPPPNISEANETLERVSRQVRDISGL